MTREQLINFRNQLMKLVEDEREKNIKYGIKYLSRQGYKNLNTIWKLDEQIMNLTSSPGT